MSGTTPARKYPCPSSNRPARRPRTATTRQFASTMTYPAGAYRRGILFSLFPRACRCHGQTLWSCITITPHLPQAQTRSEQRCHEQFAGSGGYGRNLLNVINRSGGAGILFVGPAGKENKHVNRPERQHHSVLPCRLCGQGPDAQVRNLAIVLHSK